MQWFYFVKSKNRVALWAQHYGTGPEADDAFYDCVRMYYPVPTILYDRGYPMYTYYAYLAKETEQETKPAATAHVRVQL